MKIVDITTRRPSMSDTRTYEEFTKFLGELFAPLVMDENRVNKENSRGGQSLTKR